MSDKRKIVYNEDCCPPDGGCFGMLLVRAVSLLLIAFSLIGCAKGETTIREVPVIVRDTVVKVQMRVDSVMRTDSTWSNTYTKGDSVFKETGRETKERIVERLRDTVYVTKSVPVEIVVEKEKPVIKQVPAKFSKSQRAIIAIAYSILVGVLLALLIYLYIYRSTRVKSIVSLILKKLIRNR